MINKEYHFERATMANIGNLCCLFIANGNQSYSEAFFLRKFDTLYTGISYVGYFAVHTATGQIAAFYAVFPCFMRYNGEKILAAQSGDTITHPRHQQKGLFIALARETYRLAKEEGVRLVYGFPNQNSSHGLFAKLDWVRDRPFNVYEINVWTIPIYKICRKLHLTHLLYYPYLRLLQAILKSSPEIWEHNLLANEQGLIRDRAYFEYKKYSPSFLVTIRGVACWFKTDEALQCGDILVKDISNVRLIIPVLKFLAAIIGVQRISLTVTDGAKLDLTLKDYIQPVAVSDNTGHLILDEKLPEQLIPYIGADRDIF